MNYELRRLGDVAEIVGGGTPSTKRSEFWDGEIPWLTPKDLSSFDGVYVERGARSITNEGLAASSAKMLPPGSVLYTSRAPIGYVAIASNAIATNQGFKSLVLKDGYVPEYVFYLLKASKSEIESHASGGTFAEISAKAIADVMLPFPPFENQQAIASLLSSLDLKMEINRSVSKNLEALARNFFKSWFIDFDPVKAKMAGEEPVGMDPETAELFPDSMEDSELGEIPAGWSVGTLVDFFNLVMGQSPPGSAYNSEGGGEPFFQGRAEFGERFPTQRLSSTLGNRRAAKGDVLVSVRAPVGDQNQALVDCIIGRGLAAIRHKSGSQPYSYEFVRSIQGQLDFFNGQGSVFGSISKRDFESLQVLEPPDALIQAFDSICSPIDELLRNLHVQNESLAGIRDALLPRLVSGELEIPDEMLAA